MAESPAVFPAWIASKGRADACRTAELLAGSGVTFRVAVEPHEAEVYARRWGRDRLEVLPESHRGIAYVRNHILDLCRPASDWFWMLDDDIRAFYRVVSGRNVVAPARDVLLGAQTLFSGRPMAAQAALEYGQFAWSARSAMTLAGYCDVAVCIHAGRAGMARYRPEMDLKEDRDFTLQLLSSGWETVRVQRWAFVCPKNGSNVGGLSPVYAVPGREAEASRRMAEAWGPDVCRPVTKSDGRPDVKINWRYFRATSPKT